jgi:hypothetical protein
MMRLVALCLFLLVSPWCAATETLDPRKAAISCVDGCQVTFMELVPNRAAYDGEEIYIIGFLAITNGWLSLQPSEQAYMAGTGDPDSIIIKLPASFQRRIIDDHLNSYVSVRGVFNVGPVDRLVGLGYFTGPLKVNKGFVRKVPESDWKVPLEDLD